MTVALTVKLPFGVFEAASADDWDRGEWPPHPARVFCSLVGGAEDDKDWAVLAVVESWPPPQVWACDEVLASPSPSTYVVTNKLAASGGSQTHLGRTNGLRRKPRVNPAVPSFALVWPDGALDSDGMRRLRRLAWSVPHVGRSTSFAVVDALQSAPDPEPGWVQMAPVRLDAGGTPLRVPYPGYLSELRVAFEEGGSRPWELARPLNYASVVKAVEERSTTVVQSQFPGLAVYRFPSGVRIEGSLTARVTKALRAAILAVIGDDIPAEVSGHDVPDRTHVACLALPDVGHPHADGHLLGIAVAVPIMDAAATDRVLRRILDQPGLRFLSLPGVGRLEVSEAAGGRLPDGLREERWRGPADVWESATPVVLDRWPTRRGEFGPVLEASFARLGLPEVIELAWSTAPLVAGGVSLRPRDLARDADHGRPFVHVRVRFARPVTGPLLAGRERYLGMGLFAPKSWPR